MLPMVGQQFPVMHGLTTILPDADYETYSEAGYQWVDVPGYWKDVARKSKGVSFVERVWVEPTVELQGLRHAGKTKRGLTVVGTYNYVLHPTFRVIQLAYNLKNGDGARIWRPDMPDPTDLFEWIKRYKYQQSLDCPEGLLEAWNVFFESCVWNLYCVPKLGWPPLYLDQQRCCMAKSAVAGYPRSLDNAGSVLRLVNQKDSEGKKLKLTVPKEPTKKDPGRCWTPETAPEDFRRFYAYNVQDIMAESEASSKIPDLPTLELERWMVDQRINHRGMQIDLIAVENCLAIIEQATTRDNAELRLITHGAVQAFSEVAKTIEWLKTQGVYLDGLDEDVVEEELAKNHTRAVKRVLEIRRALSFGSVKKLNGMWLQACPDGRLRDMFAFAANHTQHWAGVGPQVMNLYKGKFNKPEQVEFALGVLASRDLGFVERVFANGPPWDKEDNEPMGALDVIANCLRSMIIARPGTRLITADYNAIQAVITAALAGEKWQLDVFHAGGQIYLETASQLTGKPVQYYVDYRKANGKHHPDRQLYGKIPTLANGFGAYVGGWRRFDDEGILGSDDEVKALIFKTWAKNPNICELWGGQTRNKFGRDRFGRRANEYPECYGLEGAAIKAVLNPGVCYPYRGIRYQVHNNVLYCMSPGGGAPLIYHEPHVMRSTREHARPWEMELTYVGWNSNQTKGKGGWVRMDFYGGVATQNIVAKVHREFQADTLVALDKTGIYLPVHHGHDENVTEVEDGKGSKDEYLSIVNRGKAWAVDDWGRPWPVKAPSADETQRYGKWE
jgi:DNA polymerase bacteriophage-type